MKRYLILFVAMAFSMTALAQNSITLILKDATTQDALVGATVTITDLKKASATDAKGQVTLTDISNGWHRLESRFVGYTLKVDSLQFPLDNNNPLVILLEAAGAEDLEEVMVTSTRSSRTIANIPTRIEVIAGEELDEKANMKPGDIRMVLNETTGIQTQQTSANKCKCVYPDTRTGWPLYADS
jgi:outer membrane receptor for ferrienterochelin and colicins